MDNRINLIACAYVLLFLLWGSGAYAAVGTSGVEQWYLKSTCNNNGDGLARTCAASAGASGAFNSSAGIIWTSTTGIDDGDTLWVLGELREQGINPGTAAGSAGNTIKLRWDDATEPGTTNNKHLMTEATTSGNWTNAGGNVWYLSMSSYTGNSRTRRVWKNGVEILQAPTLVDVGTFYQGSATRSEWWYDSGTVRLYLYSVGNPAGSITTLESLAVPSGSCNPFGVCFLSASNAYFDIINPNIEATNGANIVCLGCDHITIFGTTSHRKSCKLGKDSLASVLIADSSNAGTGTIASDITVYQCTMDNTIPNSVADSRFEWQQQGDQVLINFGATNISILNNDIIDGTHGQVIVNATLGTTTVTNVTVEGNYMFARNALTYARAVGVDGNTLGKATRIKFRRNWMENFAIQSQMNGNGNEFVANVVANQREDITWKNAVLGGKGDMLNIQAYSDISQDNIIANNTFYNSPYGRCLSFFNSSPGVAQGHLIQNNIFFGCPLGGAIYRPSASNLGNQTFRNNVIYTTGQTSLIHYKGTNYTVSAWEAACSGDVCTGNIAADPQFISPTNLRPSTGSPARMAGLPYAECIDYFGGACVNPNPDIGAIQTLGTTGATLRLR